MVPTMEIQPGLTRHEAERLQSLLAPRVIVEDRFDRIDIVAGVDVAYARHGGHATAAIAILRASDLSVLEIRTLDSTVHFPYLPGLFAFRELPAICALLSEVTLIPDLLICDGQGIAHPRRFGLACHLGLMFDVPTIGCAKTLLVGSSTEPGVERGAAAPLLYDGITVGCTLRTRAGVKPVYTSPGHKVSISTACDWVLRLAPRFRLPEPLRLADQAARRAALKWKPPNGTEQDPQR